MLSSAFEAKKEVRLYSQLCFGHTHNKDNRSMIKLGEEGTREIGEEGIRSLNTEIEIMQILYF
jgi:hypothetical protein